MNILADAALPGLTQAFPQPFNLTTYEQNEDVNKLLSNQDILLCRATLKINNRSLKENQLRFVATASSGTDHLDLPYLQSQNITVIDAKGCNATSVADYVISSVAYLAQEKLITGTKVGIIGLGKVGTKVSQRLNAADFEVAYYDPPKAEQDPTFTSCDITELYQADLLCIHAELHHQQPYPSANLINKAFLAKLKPGCIIINAARGGIVNEEELLSSKTPLIYCTDVYLNEPYINKEIIAKATLCTPHIAGHSLEAKFYAVAIVSTKLHQHLELATPSYAKPSRPAELKLNKNDSWQDLALSIYNPIEETRLLKKTILLDASFVQLRQNHQNRHNFNTYFNNLSQFKTILGVTGF